MRNSVALTFAVLVCQGCALFQAPPEVKYLKPVAARELSQYQQRVTWVALEAVKKWQLSETRRVMDDHWIELDHFSKANPGKFSPLYVKAQTIIVQDKLRKIREAAGGVTGALSRAEIHLNRSLQILELFNDWMNTGLTRGDAEEVKRFFKETSEKWLAVEKDKLLLDMKKKMEALEKAAEEEK